VSDFDLRIISLGAGVQSSTLYWLAHEGEVSPKPDYAIFADTQQEPYWVYENLDYMEKHGSIPIHRVSNGDLGADVEAGVNSTGGSFSSVPFWVVGSDGRETLGRRQCTREYKIDVVKMEIRTLLGLTKGQRAAGVYNVEEWVGISVDEASRAKPSRYPWVTTRWPLLFDRPMRRAECKAWLTRHGYPIPRKSACVFCPYRGAAEYAAWRRDEPGLFEEACRVDDLIRSSGTKKAQYILRTLKPLREMPEDPPDDPQIDLFENECEGMCGV